MVERQPHKLKVVGSIPAPAPNLTRTRDLAVNIPKGRIRRDSDKAGTGQGIALTPRADPGIGGKTLSQFDRPVA